MKIGRSYSPRHLACVSLVLLTGQFSSVFAVDFQAVIESSLSELQESIEIAREKNLAEPFVIDRNSEDIVDKMRQAERALTEKPVYEYDDRVNYYGASAKYQHAAKSTAVMVGNSDLIPLSNGTFALPDRRIGLCEAERFSAEPAPGLCSAFRVGDNLLGTAGHCIKNQEDCSKYSFVFGFRYDDETDSPRMNISKESVYACKSIKKHKLDSSTGADWAVIELDRAMSADIPTVELSSDVTAPTGDNVTVIGYPSGLPLKVARNGEIRSSNEFYFVATTDTFGGNSGSAVFDTNAVESGKLLVKGVLVRGETDYDVQRGCLKAKICKKDKCSGEDITHAKYLR